MPFNWNKHYAIKNQYEKTIGQNIPHRPGIYLWTRVENGITFFYVGQAKDLHNRRFDYYKIQTGIAYPSRHFEASLKKHKDWKFDIITCCEEFRLNELEKYYIDLYNALPNHITRNTAIANQDIVQNNAKRINKVINKYQSRLKELLKRVSIDINEYHINISYFINKDNKINKNSKKAFDEIIHWFEDLLKDENM